MINKTFLKDCGKEFVLNVLGAAGAIWVSSEVIGLRNSTNPLLWRGISGGTGIIFFAIFLTERYNSYKKINTNNNDNNNI